MLQELEMFKDELVDRPAVLALNKIDKPGSEDTLQEILPQIDDLEGKIKDYCEGYRIRL